MYSVVDLCERILLYSTGTSVCQYFPKIFWIIFPEGGNTIFLCVKKEPTNLRLLTRSSALHLMWLSLWWYVAQFERSFLTQQIWFSSYLLSEQEFPIYSLCQRKKTMRNSDIAQHNASFTATHGRTGYLFAPHVLRHTKAFRLLETGINVFYIRNLLRR